MIEINDKSVKEFDKRQAIRDTVCDFLLSKNLLVASTRFNTNDFYVHNTLWNKLKNFISHPSITWGNDRCLFYISFGDEQVIYGQKEQITTARIESANSSKKTMELINELSEYLDEKGWKVIVTLTKDKFSACKYKKK